MFCVYLSEIVRFRINADPMYESNKNSIVDMHRNSYIAFVHAGSCNVWITAPVTDSTGDGIRQSQQIQVIPWPHMVLTYSKFRILRGPLNRFSGDWGCGGGTGTSPVPIACAVGQIWGLSGDVCADPVRIHGNDPSRHGGLVLFYSMLYHTIITYYG